MATYGQIVKPSVVGNKQQEGWYYWKPNLWQFLLAREDGKISPFMSFKIDLTEREREGYISIWFQKCVYKAKLRLYSFTMLSREL